MISHNFQVFHVFLKLTGTQKNIIQYTKRKMGSILSCIHCLIFNNVELV